MPYNRRQALLLAGGSVSTVFLAGCLGGDPNEGNGEGGTGDDGDGDGDGNGNSNGDGDSNSNDNELEYGKLPDKLERVDAPSYEIDEEDCNYSDDNDRDPLYLCDGMADEPSLSFEQKTTTRSLLSDDGLEMDPDHTNPQQYVTLLTDESDRERVDLESENPAVELIDEADFDEEAILIAQTGWGSGSETPHIERIEETETGIHAFGCYRRPCIMTSDFTSRTVVARFDRPESLETGITSLTVDPETRVNVAAGEGVVTLDEGGDEGQDEKGEKPSLPDHLERVDEPPHEIDEKECDTDSDNERDPLYLCENMSSSPSLEFTQENGSVLTDSGLGHESDGDASGSQFYATLLVDEDDRDRVDLKADRPANELVAETNFDEEAILIAQTGWGSGSVTPHIERIEETEDGVHVHGCYRRPCTVTLDLTSRTVVVRFERPESLESAIVSLTATPENRVNFAAGEGVVTLDGMV